MGIKRNIEAECKFTTLNWEHSNEVFEAICAKASEYSATLGKIKNVSAFTRYYDTADLQILRSNGAIRITGNDAKGFKATVKKLFVENPPELATPKELLRLASSDGLLVRHENSQEGSKLITDYSELINELFPNVAADGLSVKAMLYKSRVKVRLKNATGTCEVAIDSYDVISSSNRVKTRYELELETVGGTNYLTCTIADMLELEHGLKRTFNSKYQDVMRAKKAKY